jgi:hypothetical protein
MFKITIFSLIMMATVSAIQDSIHAVEVFDPHEAATIRISAIAEPPARVLQSSSLTDVERKYLTEFMLKTKERLVRDVKGLNPAQLNFKPDSSRWSVAECVEHITITENTNMARVTEGLKVDPDASKRSQISLKDEDLLKRYTDRSNKRTTSEALAPKSRFGSHEAALAEFLKKRNANIDFVKSTREDLRNRITTYSFGTIDLYQCMLALTAHSERHIVQLEEVMADPGFPK